MKIKSVKTTPLHCAFKVPYHWAQGINYGTPVILIEVETDTGVIGIGESVASPVIAPVLAIIHDAIPHFIGKSAYDGNRIIWDYYQFGFNSKGTGSAPRYFSQALAGIELALWDAIGKSVKLPLHQLLGGALERFRRCLNRVCCQISLVCDSTWRLAGRPDCHATTSFHGFTRADCGSRPFRHVSAGCRQALFGGPFDGDQADAGRGANREP